MCGIAGIMDIKAAREVNRDALQRMTNALAHRGPDGEGFFYGAGIGLGHRRLSIIDLDNGQQPFTSSDGSHILTYNGEIYNYPELSQKITTPLKTRCDTEIVAELLATKGTAGIADLTGMFAFAVWNQRERKLLLGRDRLGERPLYYTVTQDGWFLFASEMPALLASAMVQRDIDPQSVTDYLSFGYVPDPKTIYRNVFRLPAASFLQVKSGSAKPFAPQTYWHPSLSPKSPAQKDDLLHHLDQAVKRQLMADVPLGAFLSGGVDSSAIVASMVHNGVEKPASFTISFPDASNDDGLFATKIAEQFNTNHSVETVSLNETAMVDTIAHTYGEPFADSSALPTFLVCKSASKFVKVALSGDGSDEIFAGYRRYRLFAREEQFRRVLPQSFRQPVFGALGQIWPKFDYLPQPLRLKTTLQSLADTSAHAYARSVSAILPERLVNILSPDVSRETNMAASMEMMTRLFNEADTDDTLLAAQYADVKSWLPGRMLVKVDRAAMANSLEVRVPFLDHQLVEYALSLPTSARLNGSEGKALLKNSQEDRLPHDILYRPKKGFDMPVERWLKQPDAPMVTKFLASKHWQESEFFDVTAVKKMLAQHQQGRMNYAQEIWSMIMFDAFLRAQT